MCRARSQPKIQGFYQNIEPKGYRRDSGKLYSGGYCSTQCHWAGLILGIIIMK